jgi:PEP-CTERM motif
MKTFFKKSRLTVALTALSLLSGGAAQAAIFEIDFTTSGAFNANSSHVPTSPGLNTVFATALFDDNGGSGSVTLTMSVLNNLSAGAYVNDWFFNVSSAPLTSVTFVPGGGATAATTVSFTADCCKADGTGGDFDLRFQFPTNSPGELAQGHTSVYNLVGANITANSFNSFSVNAGTGGPYLSALHVQGYGDSAWIGAKQGGDGGGGGAQIPEPATLALMGLGLFGIAATRRRRP